MKVLLICPADRPAVSCLAENWPLALTPLLGRSVVEYWIEALVPRGVTQITVLASDRPNQVRHTLGDGTRWGIQLTVAPQTRELTAAEARRAYQKNGDADWLSGSDVIVLEHLPDRPDHPLFESYAGWFSAILAFAPHAITPARIGVKELQPGIWVGLHTQIAPGAQLHAPCWIGEDVVIADQTFIGPGAIIENHVIVEPGASIRESSVGPDTYVGRNISLQNSLAYGSTVVNWRNDSCLHVPDDILLCSLSERRAGRQGSGVVGRVLAGAAMLATSPIALPVMAWSLVRGDTPLRVRLGVRPKPHVQSAALQTFAYYELTGGSNWLKRWPQFWSVVRGDLRWVGNRPLRPTEALALGNAFERLWLNAPVGLVSLADAHGCTDGLTDEVCAHASYYAVNASRRLTWFVLTRALLRAASAIPIGPRSRRKSAAVLPRLVSKQEG